MKSKRFAAEEERTLRYAEGRGIRDIPFQRFPVALLPLSPPNDEDLIFGIMASSYSPTRNRSLQ